AFGEAVLAGTAVEQSMLLGLAVAGADGQMAEAPLAVVGAIRVLAAEAGQVLHGGASLMLSWVQLVSWPETRCNRRTYRVQYTWDTTQIPDSRFQIPDSRFQIPDEDGSRIRDRELGIRGRRKGGGRRKGVSRNRFRASPAPRPST